MRFDVIIPAAGAATRLRPLTNNCSKAMVRLHGKPAIAYILDSLYEYGAENIVIVDGQYDDIREYCESKYPEVQFIKQVNLKGPRDAISLGAAKLFRTVSNNPIVVWLGDTIVLDKDLPLGSDFLLVKDDVEDHSQWCMWRGKYFYDKPENTIPGAKALVGVYSFSNRDAFLNAFRVEGYDISNGLCEYPFHFKSVTVSEWYDIGTLSSYQKTCAALLQYKSREFNSFKYNEELNTIQKIGKGVTDELRWYKSLSSTQSLFAPRLIDMNDDTLHLSYESGTLLSDLLLYENLPQSTIAYLVDKIFSIMTKNFWIPTKNSMLASHKMWVVKSGIRLENSDFSIVEKLELMNVARRCSESVSFVKCIHGDLHGGNILYDPYNDSIKFIDPRGRFGDDVTNSGDVLYDLAKLSHDFYHGYGSILAGRPYPDELKTIFVDTLNKYGYNSILNEVIDAGVLLIATCISLHSDDSNRQQRMKNYVTEYFGF